MARSITNKVEKKPLDFTSLFGTAGLVQAPQNPNAIERRMQEPLVNLSNLSAMNAPSTTAVDKTNPTALASFSGTPLNYADSQGIQNQVNSIAGNPNPLFQQGIKGMVPTPAGVSTPITSQQAAPTFSGIIYDLIKKATEQDKNVEATRANAMNINEKLEKQKEMLAKTLGGIKNDAIPLEFQQGRAQVAQQQGAEILNALGSQFTGATNLADQALTERNQTLSALQGAGSLGQPSPTAFGQTTFNPLEGGFSGGGGLPPEVMQQYAQMAANGQYSAIPSFITSNPVLNAQLNVAAKSYNPAFNPVQAQGASNILGGIPALQSAETAADGIKNTITSYLQQNPNLNPNDLAASNILQQWIQGKQLTDPKYQILFNYLDEYTNTLAPILGVGGAPTNLKTQIAQGFVNAAASGQSITQVLNSISALAKNKVIDMQRGAVGQGTSVPESTGTGGFAETW